MRGHMAERLVFEFEGALADQHRMNFYEASRFQYAAARLLVKLSQFRNSGRFRQKITDLSNVGITLEAQEEGSFRINVDAPDAAANDAEQNAFLDVPLANLLSYVSERIIAKTDDDELIALINGHRELVDRFGRIPDGDGEQLERVIRMLVEDHGLRAHIFPEAAEIIERRISEVGREDRLIASRAQIARIDPAREQKLISMASPLVSEMATALRRSANTLRIQSVRRGEVTNVLYLNKRMAQEIESSDVDDEITPILGDIIQYNKETGWGKVRLQIAAHPLSFSVPSDMKAQLQETLLRQMGRDQVYLQVYIVRDRAREPLRLILAGILPLPE